MLDEQGNNGSKKSSDSRIWNGSWGEAEAGDRTNAGLRGAVERT
jgi:hypothetical protein